jgi:N-acetylglutamate synthase-like GNAT family acetyltransferase
MLNIRRARREDCEAIGKVHTAAVSAIRTDLYTPEELQSWAVPKSAEAYDELIRSREFFVADADGVIIGFGVLDQENGVVEAVYVGPEMGGRGIGLELLRQLEKTALAFGLTVLRLNASLNAVPFYQKAGYVAQERARYKLASGVEIDCVPMVKVMIPAADAS